MPLTVTMNKNTADFILLHVLALYGLSMCAAKCKKPEEYPLHEIHITNSMSQTAPVRCFRYALTDNYLGNMWLKPRESTSFKFRYILSPETIYYCTTTNGSFVAYRQSYDCAQNKVNLCEWRIYEAYAELYSIYLQRWVRFDYEPAKSPTCYKDLCLRFPRGYPSHKPPCHKESPQGTSWPDPNSALYDLSPK
ncbi:hypothetical protein PTKIN_Ptkin05aG0049300 [Pterospermum kingtungense]